MASRFDYIPIPAVCPRVLRAAGRYFLQQAQPISMTPLGLSEALSAGELDGSEVVSELLLPTDLLISAWRGLFPAERMMFVSGRRKGHSIQASSVRDVTSNSRSVVHVKACSARLRETLLDFEAARAPVVAWLHSHPGTGPWASYPSSIDRRQDAELRRDFGERLVGLIMTVDGYLRIWGQAIDEALIQVRLDGCGIQSIAGEPHVYRATVR